MRWLNANELPKDVDTVEGRRSHAVFTHIDNLFEGSGKIARIRELLHTATLDRTLAVGAGPDATPLKKHACVFTARPGTAFLLACWADKNLSTWWKVVVLLATTKDRQAVIDTAFEDAPFGEDGLPTLFIASIRVCGIGMNGLQKANHCIIAELPLSESQTDQAVGREHRMGQRFPVTCTILNSDDNVVDKAINDRHRRRDAAWGDIMSHVPLQGEAGNDGEGWGHV